MTSPNLNSVIPQRFAPIIAEVAEPAHLFRSAGKRVFLVGGTVRDLMIDRAGGEMDFDLTTDAHPDEIRAIIAPWADAVWAPGERFGTVACRKGDRTYEITTHRAEAYSPDSRKPEVRYSKDIEEDLSRRDFTVNAMALEITSDAPTLVDPFGGMADLMSKTCVHRSRQR